MRNQNIHFNLLIICLLALLCSPLAQAQTGSLTVQQDAKITELLTLKKSFRKGQQTG